MQDNVVIVQAATIRISSTSSTLEVVKQKLFLLQEQVERLPGIPVKNRLLQYPPVVR
jgi:hypothetical protein